MTATIVVGLDGSPSSTAAARWAQAEARRRRATLQAVTVFGVLEPEALPDRPRLVTDRQFTQACSRMQREQLAGVRDPQVRLVSRIAHGDPAEQLVAAARDADLLVVGARGHGGIAELLVGSVSLHCVQRCACPVTVVPAYVAEAEPGAPVVVGVDGSAAGLAALGVAVEEAAMRHVPVLAVHAVHWRSLGTDLVRPSDAQLLEWGTRLISGVVEPVRAEWPDMVIEQRVVAGHPARVLDDAAGATDLLVVGSRGHGRLAGLLLGSVSMHLLQHARRPTLVVADKLAG